MAAVHSAHTNPLMSHTATCERDDEKQLFDCRRKPLRSALAENFKIPLAVKDGDGQDKQETPDSEDF